MLSKSSFYPEPASLRDTGSSKIKGLVTFSWLKNLLVLCNHRFFRLQVNSSEKT